MTALPDESVDCIITDPPYGTTKLDWDTVPDLDAMFREFNRVAKPNCVMLIFGQQPFVTDLINTNRKYYRYELIWCKTNPMGFLDANRKPLRIHENISVFYKKLPVYNPIKTKGMPYRKIRRNENRYTGYGSHKRIASELKDERYPTTILFYSNNNGRTNSLHPTQKSLALVEYLILSYSNYDSIILDPFLGSGTTAIAAIRTNRRYIGMELSPEYCDIANKRITQELSHPQLVTMPERSKPVEPESKLFIGE
jgi:site-specific DNA-methyltransferase (adenine-specific)